MRMLGTVLIAVLLAVTVVSIGLMSGTGSLPPIGAHSTLLSDQELSELGLRFDPIPASAASAVITADAAVDVARLHLGDLGAPSEILHAMVRPDSESAPRSAYIVIYQGGDAIPVGLVGTRKPQVSGVVVDDQTGAFLTGFYYGSL